MERGERRLVLRMHSLRAGRANPVAPVAPVAPVGPIGPVGPVAPVTLSDCPDVHPRDQPIERL